MKNMKKTMQHADLEVVSGLADFTYWQPCKHGSCAVAGLGEEKNKTTNNCQVADDVRIIGRLLNESVFLTAGRTKRSREQSRQRTVMIFSV